MTIDEFSFTDNCITFAHPISFSIPSIQADSPKPRAYYVASYPRNPISCSTSLYLDPYFDPVSPSMGALELVLPPMGPSECLIQDVVIPSDEDLLEEMVSVDIPSYLSIVLSNDHIFELDFIAIDPILDFPFDFDFTINKSPNISINEPFDSTIELQVGTHYDSNLMCRPLASLNDRFVPIDSTIDVNYDVPIEFGVPMWRSSNFDVDKSLLVYSTKVMYTIEYLMVDNTHVQVTIHRSNSV